MVSAWWIGHQIFIPIKDMRCRLHCMQQTKGISKQDTDGDVAIYFSCILCFLESIENSRSFYIPLIELMATIKVTAFMYARCMPSAIYRIQCMRLKPDYILSGPLNPVKSSCIPNMHFTAALLLDTCDYA